MSERDYESVNAARYPPISRNEAEKAVRRIYRHFGAVIDQSARELARPLRFRGNARRCWISRAPTTGHAKGWGRLIHDVSHRIFRARHPGWRPHEHGHATLETQIAEFVVVSGWLQGTLKGRAVQMTRKERRNEGIVRLRERLAHWEGKCRRAEKAIKKLKRQLSARARYDSLQMRRLQNADQQAVRHQQEGSKATHQDCGSHVESAEGSADTCPSSNSQE